MQRGFTKLILLVSIFTVGACLDPYNPPATTADANYLVINGFFNSNGPTDISITRTNPIHEMSAFRLERGAVVQVEGDDGTVFNLTENLIGHYALPTVLVDTGKKYRLKVRTTDSQEYASDFVPVRESPPIDSVDYAVDGETLHFHVSSHDDSGNSRYYLWKFTETWLYVSRFPSEFVFDRGQILPRQDRFEIYHCYSTVQSDKIIIGTSSKLAEDIIHEYVFNSVGLLSMKVNSKYSVEVEQYVLTKEAYEYWSELRKNTESLGTIFDPQPSQNFGNIHAITDPTRPVIGYFSISSGARKRIFVSGDDLPNVRRTTGYETCELDTLSLAEVPAFTGGRLFVFAWYNRTELLGYVLSSPYCVDCRMNGGTNVKPDFWE